MQARVQLDTRMAELLSHMEAHWLGPWRVLLSHVAPSARTVLSAPATALAQVCVFACACVDACCKEHNMHVLLQEGTERGSLEIRSETCLGGLDRKQIQSINVWGLGQICLRFMELGHDLSGVKFKRAVCCASPFSGLDKQVRLIATSSSSNGIRLLSKSTY